MTEADIEILESERVIEQDETVSLPVNFVPVGDVDSDGVQVYIKQDVYKRIEKYAKEEMSKEVGSILVGDYIAQNGKKTVVISDYIQAKYTDATASTLTFTHETWDYVHKEKDKKYPDKKIVGWQHTHPGYGIFLSSYDVFIQENFFNLDWQIAYVVDPIADTRGFFEWKNGETSKMSGFYIYDEVDEEINIVSRPKASKGRSVSVVTLIMAFLLVVSVLFNVSLTIEKNNVEKKADMSVSTQPVQPESLPEDLPEDVVKFKVYTVKYGDCLEKILADHGLDYAENINTVMKINSIKDANKIIAGTQIYLPVTE